MENSSEPRKTRRNRRKASQTVVHSESVDTEALEAQGFQKVQARDSSGQFQADNPSTPEDEAFEWVKPNEKEEPLPTAQKEEAVEEDTVKVVSEPAAALDPPAWAPLIRPMKRKKKNLPPQRGVIRKRR